MQYTENLDFLSENNSHTAKPKHGEPLRDDFVESYQFRINFVSCSDPITVINNVVFPSAVFIKKYFLDHMVQRIAKKVLLYLFTLHNWY